MRFGVHESPAPGSPGPTPRRGPRPGSSTGPGAPAPLGPGAVAWSIVAAVGIGGALALMIAASLTRGNWMNPPLPMPTTGPPFELTSWHVSAQTVTTWLWLATLVGGAGVAAGLAAVRRGARPPVWLLLTTAALVVAALTVLPPAGSTDLLDYAAFGRMQVLGHSPYVMTPRQLIATHDAISRSVPIIWERLHSPYGPAASFQQFLAAVLGGTSAARITFWLKLCDAVAFGLVAVVADRLLRHDQQARLRAHLLWTANPLLIWQLVAAGHLDVLAAAAGLLGLLVAGGWPGGQPVRARLGRAAAGGLLVGLAVDVKISYILFGLGLAWALYKSASRNSGRGRRSAGRRSLAPAGVAALGIAAAVLPGYAWFGLPAIAAVLKRNNNVSGDNFYYLFSYSHHHAFLIRHVAVIAAVLVVALAILAMRWLPGRQLANPAIFAALVLSTAWLFVWQYQLPSYDAMIVCLLIVYPATGLDWLVVGRLTAATFALMPGNPYAEHDHLQARIGYYAVVLGAPVVLLAAAFGLVALCVAESLRARRADRSATTTSTASPASPLST
jgi:hypothetical protein